MYNYWDSYGLVVVLKTFFWVCYNKKIDLICMQDKWEVSRNAYKNLEQFLVKLYEWMRNNNYTDVFCRREKKWRVILVLY